jgi:hypothetical protein
MPKDPTKNIFQYKIRGGHLNEYEFQQNQGDVTEQQLRPWEKENYDPNALMPGEEPEGDGKGRERVLAKPNKSASKRAAKSTKKSTKKQAATKTKRRSVAKKTTQKAAAKKTAKKSAAKKSPGRTAATGRARKAFKKRKVRAGVR